MRKNSFFTPASVRILSHMRIVLFGLLIAGCWLSPGNAIAEATSPGDIPPPPKISEIFLDEGDYYLVRGEKVFIRRDANRMVVKFTDTAFASLQNACDQKEVQAAVVQSALKVSDSQMTLSSERVLQKHRIGIVRAHLNPRGKLIRSSIQEMAMSPSVEYAYPLFITKTGLDELILTDEIVARFSPDYGEEEVSAFCAENDLSLVRKTRGPLNIYVLRLNSPKSRSSFDAANSLNDKKAIVWAEPNFLSKIKLLTNDPLFPDQWHLNDTGQGGGKVDVDVDAPEAWALQTGSPDIVIAILDTGVDLDHEDLEICHNPGEWGGGKEGNGIDDDGNGYVDDYCGWDFFSHDNNPSPGDSHGTACAGVAAAKGDNAIGVAGIAYGCRVLPVKICGPEPDNEFAPPEGIGEAIMYAADLADVISCSWVYQESSCIMDAIDYAVTSGRDGRGCPVFFGTGNDAARGWREYRATKLLFTLGEHAHGWIYFKDESGTGGADAAWVDQVTLQDGTVETFDECDPPNLPPDWYDIYKHNADWETVNDPNHAYGESGNSVRSGVIDPGEHSGFYVQKDYPVQGTYSFYVWVDAAVGDGLYSFYFDWVEGIWTNYELFIGEGIRFPASYTESIAVGACTNMGIQDPGSQYGDELDFVAPGRDITTTDRTGGAGYSETNYYHDFSGTSAVTPLAAGIAALMLSAKPDLTASEVREIMQDTCKKIGEDPYDGSGWNKYYGHGCVNAFNALKDLLPIISGKVTTKDGTPVEGVVMNGLPNAPKTDSNGLYSDTVSSGWSGTVTPQHSSYNFTPPNRYYSNVTSDRKDQDYEANPGYVIISGNVTTEDGTPVEGVVMNGLPNAPKTSIVGSYLDTVPSGWSGTVTPEHSSYTFKPPSRTYSDVTSPQTNQDYEATSRGGDGGGGGCFIGTAANGSAMVLAVFSVMVLLSTIVGITLSVRVRRSKKF